MLDTIKKIARVIKTACNDDLHNVTNNILNINWTSESYKQFTDSKSFMQFLQSENYTIPGRRIVVSEVSSRTSHHRVLQLFSTFGEIESHRILSIIPTKTIMICYRKLMDAFVAVNRSRCTRIDNRLVNVAYEGYLNGQYQVLDNKTPKAIEGKKFPFEIEAEKFLQSLAKSSPFKIEMVERDLNNNSVPALKYEIPSSSNVNNVFGFESSDLNNNDVNTTPRNLETKVDGISSNISEESRNVKAENIEKTNPIIKKHGLKKCKDYLHKIIKGPFKRRFKSSTPKKFFQRFHKNQDFNSVHIHQDSSSTPSVLSNTDLNPVFSNREFNSTPPSQVKQDLNSVQTNTDTTSTPSVLSNQDLNSTPPSQIKSYFGSIQIKPDWTSSPKEMLDVKAESPNSDSVLVIEDPTADVSVLLLDEIHYLE